MFGTCNASEGTLSVYWFFLEATKWSAQSDEEKKSRWVF